LTFFSDEAWFHLQGYINTQNNRYWSSQNPHLTHEVPLHPVKVGVWYAESSRIVGPMFLNEKVNCERYVQVILGQFFLELREGERLYGWLQQDSATAHTARMYMQALSESSGTELSAVVFGQQVHPILILVIFSSGID
jgi:hypothetical protein